MRYFQDFVKGKFWCVLLMILGSFMYSQKIDVTKFGVEPNSKKDAVKGVREALKKASKQKKTILYFPKGRYDFYPEDAEANVYFITNTSNENEYPSKLQKTGLLIKNLRNVVIEGNQSTFVFHGKMISWIVDHSENITFKNITVDYDRPGMSEMTIVSKTNAEVIAKIHPDSKFKIENGTLKWIGHQWETIHHFAVIVNPKEGINKYSSWIPFLNSKAEKINNDEVSFKGDFSKFNGEAGQILTIRDHYRDYVGALHTRSKNIQLENVKMQYMHGLGIVSQFSENLTFQNVKIKPDANSGRVIASSADGMQFSGCKGKIIINNCEFSGMHDDAINIHGTHLKIVSIEGKRLLTLRFMHHQTYGFLAVDKGDEIEFLKPSTLKIFDKAKVVAARMLSDREIQIELQEDVPKEVVVNDFIENVTWTPSVLINNSRISGTQTRGILVSTRKPVLIENTLFYRTGMAAILIENDAMGWFESGPVRDVTIRNNVFQECGYNLEPDNFAIQISPHNTEWAKDYWIHQNISITNNLFKVYSDPLLSARSVQNLNFSNNKIIRTRFLPSGDKRSSFVLEGNTDVRILNNDFSEGNQPTLKLNNMKRSDIVTDIQY